MLNAPLHTIFTFSIYFAAKQKKQKKNEKLISSYQFLRLCRLFPPNPNRLACHHISLKLLVTYKCTGTHGNTHLPPPALPSFDIWIEVLSFSPFDYILFNIRLHD